MSLVKECVAALAKDVFVEKVILFGSFARGTGTIDSDIDLIVVMSTNEPKPTRAIQLLKYFDNISHDVNIDVITPKEWSRKVSDPGFLTATILSEGIVLFNNSERTLA